MGLFDKLFNKGQSEASPETPGLEALGEIAEYSQETGIPLEFITSILGEQGLNTQNIAEVGRLGKGKDGKQK